MNKLFLGLAIVAVLLGSVALATPAFAAFSFEDPQLCVEGKLLRVDPTTAPMEVWVGVGKDVEVSFDVASCGGDPNLPVINPSQVKRNFLKHYAELVVRTSPGADVVIHWDGATNTVDSGADGLLFFIRRVN